MQIVTGRTGSPHITSVQDRALNQGLAGKGTYILDTGQNLSVEIATSNEIHIKDGGLLFQGCLAVVEKGTYDTVTIANGSQGMKRKDLIVARYTYSAQSQTESVAWATVQGTPDAANPVVPEISNTGDIQALDPLVDTAVFVVTLDSVSIVSVEPVISKLDPLDALAESIKDLNSKYTSLSERTQNLNNTANTLTADVNGLSSDVEELSDGHQELSEDVTEIQGLIFSKLLWTGNERMRDGRTITLSEGISKQAHGIALKWQLAASESADPYGDTSYQVIFKGTNGFHTHGGGAVDFGVNCRKRINIANDTSITGTSYNAQSGTNNGVTYNNNRMVLVAVYGW